MAFKAVRLFELPRAVSIDREENYWGFLSCTVQCSSHSLHVAVVPLKCDSVEMCSKCKLHSRFRRLNTPQKVKYLINTSYIYHMWKLYFGDN